MQVKYNQAILIATKAIDREIQRVSIQANLYEIYKMASGKIDADHRKKLRQAKGILSGQHIMELG